MEKNLAQHRAYDKNLKYNLEIYYKFFPIFFCGSPTSIETLGQDEEIEVGPNGIAQEEEVQTKEP